MYYKTRKHKRHYGGLVSSTVAEQIAQKRFKLIATAQKAAANYDAMFKNVAQKKQAILNQHQQEYETIEQQKKNATEGAEEFVAYAMKNYNQRYKNKVVPESYRKTRQNAAEKHSKNQISGIEQTATLKKQRANKTRNNALDALDEIILPQQLAANAAMNRMKRNADLAARNRLSGKNSDIVSNTQALLNRLKAVTHGKTSSERLSTEEVLTKLKKSTNVSHSRTLSNADQMVTDLQGLVSRIPNSSESKQNKDRLKVMIGTIPWQKNQATQKKNSNAFKKLGEKVRNSRELYRTLKQKYRL
jgi:hypothetical protein